MKSQFCSNCGAWTAQHLYQTQSSEVCSRCVGDIWREEWREAKQADPFLSWLYGKPSDEPSSERDKDIQETYCADLRSGSPTDSRSLRRTAIAQLLSSGRSWDDRTFDIRFGPGGCSQSDEMDQLQADLGVMPAYEGRSISYNDAAVRLKPHYLAGRSLRATEQITGISKMTVIKWFRIFRGAMGDALCPCGKPANQHRGFCSYRYSQSPSRQAYMKTLQAKRHPNAET